MAFRFESLEIWKESVGFSKIIYVTAKSFPKEELFSLVDQLKRASVSISANIAEGSGSVSDKDFKNYLNISIKSIFEVVSLLAIAEQNTYISNEDFVKLRSKAEVLVKRIQAFRNSLK